MVLAMISTFLFPILSAGAELMVGAAAGAFAKSAGADAFKALKKRLREDHDVASIDLLEQAGEKPAYAEAIKADLDAANLEADPEVKRLAETILAVIEALPDSKHPVALEADEIRARGNQIFRGVEGIRAEKIMSDTGDQTFENIKLGKT